MMDILLIKMIMAHLIGDFILQPSKWIAEKEQLKLRSGKLYLHVALHTILVFIALGSFMAWPIALVIGVSHFAIDACKLTYQKEKFKQLWFFGDQLAHIGVIIWVWAQFYQPHISIGFLQSEMVLRFIFGALFLTTPTAIIIKMVIAKWIPETNGASLQNAGKFIGILERLLIYIFIITNHFEAVGFLLTAKSVFRFGDLKEGQNLKLTEYVLIGTLLSFGIAIVTAIMLFGNQ